MKEKNGFYTPEGKYTSKEPHVVSDVFGQSSAEAPGGQEQIQEVQQERTYSGIRIFSLIMVALFAAIAVFLSMFVLEDARDFKARYDNSSAQMGEMTAVQETMCTHATSNVREERNIKQGNVTKISECASCGVQLDYDIVAMESMIDNGLMAFTADEFLDRFNYEFFLTPIEFNVVETDAGFLVEGDADTETKISLVFLQKDLTSITSMNQQPYSVILNIQFKESEDEAAWFMQRWLISTLLGVCDPKLRNDSTECEKMGRKLFEASLAANLDGDIVEKTQLNGLSYESIFISGIPSLDFEYCLWSVTVCVA